MHDVVHKGYVFGVFDVEAAGLAVGEGRVAHMRGKVDVEDVEESEGSVKGIQLSSVVEVNSLQVDVSDVGAVGGVIEVPIYDD